MQTAHYSSRFFRQIVIPSLPAADTPERRTSASRGFARMTTEPRRIYAAALGFSGRAFSSEAIIFLNQFNTADSSSSAVPVR